MRFFYALLAPLILHGCSSEFLEKHSNNFSAHTPKLPRDYLACLQEKWTVVRSTISITKTPTGYTLEVADVHIGPAALAVIDQEGIGSMVNIYQPVAQGNALHWKKSAQDCL